MWKKLSERWLDRHCQAGLDDYIQGNSHNHDEGRTSQGSTVEIKVMDNHAICNIKDIAKTGNHFGDMLIYGTIITEAYIAALISHLGYRTKMDMNIKLYWSNYRFQPVIAWYSPLQQIKNVCFGHF
jgi:hypothetical protein